MRIKYYDSNGVIDWHPDLSPLDYDEVVDYSSFRPDAESTRQLSITGKGGNIQPVYDDVENPPSDLEVALRSGKLDKAEVSQLQIIKEQEIKETRSKAVKDAKKAELEKVAQARQEYLDKATGFNGNADLSKE